MLAACENDLETFIRNNLFGPPYRREIQKLLPTNGLTNESFGFSVDIDGSYAIVGAPAADSNKGAAYIYKRNSNGSWDSGVRLTASDGLPGDSFGQSVAISGEWGVVGAPDKTIGGLAQVGGIYLFKRGSDGTWTEEQIEDIASLNSSNEGGTKDQLGYSVAIDGFRMVAGARQDNLGSGTTSYGAAYTLQFDGSHWVCDKRLDNDINTKGFGFSVKILGDLIAVGANAENNKEGVAYLYRYQTDDWVNIDKVFAAAPTANAHFGASLALETNSLLVGAPSWEGVAGDVSVFTRSGTNEWGSAIQNLVPSESKVDDYFGFGLATDGAWVLAGSPRADYHNPLSGAVFLYEKQVDGSLSFISMVAPDDSTNLSGWGVSIATDDGIAIIGESDIWNSTTGAAYIFE
jgi:hypothetical protein